MWAGGRKLGRLNIGSGNTFMLVLVNIGKKRPWRKNKKQTPHSLGTERTWDHARPEALALVV